MKWVYILVSLCLEKWQICTDNRMLFAFHFLDSVWVKFMTIILNLNQQVVLKNKSFECVPCQNKKKKRQEYLFVSYHKK